MSELHRVLVILDPSLCRTPALERAAALAAATGAELLLVLHERRPEVPRSLHMERLEGRNLSRWMRTRDSDRLQALAVDLRVEHGIRVSTVDEWEDLEATRIAAIVRDNGADLVVKDVGHEPTLRRLLFSSADWDLLRTASVPVWLVGPHSSGLPARVAAAVDPVHPEHGAGGLNDAILDMARTLVSAGKGELRILTSFEGLPPQLLAADPSGLGTPFMLDDLYDQLRTGHEEAFVSWLAKRNVPYGTGTILQGPGPKAITDAVAAAGTDVLVVGVMRRHGLDRLVMGSTAERLVVTAPCDVLAVPSTVAAGDASMRPASTRPAPGASWPAI